MKCPKCDGTGKTEIGVGAFTIHGADCDRCNGKGIVEPMTNFENITKSEESLAEWLGDLLDNEVCDPGNWNCKKCFKWCHRDKVVEWLKQPHTDKE